MRESGAAAAGARASLCLRTHDTILTHDPTARFDEVARRTGPPSCRARRKGIYILPNLFTLAALFGGFYAIVMAMNDRFDSAAIGVFCAMVLDSLDGRVARMTNTQSAFGEQMDSLSDMV